MPRLRTRSVLLLVAVALAAPASAEAQGDPYVGVPDLTTPGLSAMALELGSPFITGTPATGDARRVRKPRTATRRQLRALRFRATASRATRIDRDVTAELRAVSPPEVHPIIDDALASGSYRRAFDDAVRGFGGSPSNFADRLGSGVMLMWAVYDRETDSTAAAISPAQRKGGRRFLARLRRELARRPAVRRLSDARMQRQTDSLGLVAVHADVLTRAYANAGARTEVAELQDALSRRIADAFDIRLAGLELDADGFE